MKKLTLSLMAVLLLSASPVIAGNDHAYVKADDHSVIQPLDISGDEALKTIHQGVVELAQQIEASEAEPAKTTALKLMSAIKTLEKKPLNDKQKSALKQLEKQIDAVKHDAEDKNFTKAKSSAKKAQSALKLYEAMK